ncbi:DgyrCDS14625 [Dimorphilus gyrociliatus]|uniref:DgyrCDS14625 n=1 Tax=Dimorphilus gyrociliatus TaxID=2664684 RepID=A0A7I8WEJ1_9ANNE|nr:DgyrCDS14625 [Dimorphilus gyrociliatus]
MKIISIFIGIFIFNVHPSLERDEKLINIASKINGASCIVNSELLNTPEFNYECENALTPIWFENNDWASSCSGSLCNGRIIVISFKKSYNVHEICILQRVTSSDQIVNDVLITFQTSNIQKIYKINLGKTCILLEENVGFDSTAISFMPYNSLPASKNSGFNTIFVYAYSNDTSDIDEEDLINIADIDLGATCESFVSEIGNECHKALSSSSNLYWAPACGIFPQPSCIGSYIEIDFVYPAQPYIYSYANRYDENRYIKTMKLEWSSGFVDIQTDLPQDVFYHYYNYTHYPTIESSVKVTITNTTSNELIGLNYFKVFTKQFNQHIYTIQYDTYVVYSLPQHLHGNFMSIKFRVKGHQSGQSNDCSSFIMTFKNCTSEIFTLKLDIIENGEKSSSIETIEPVFNSINFSESSPLMSCDSWSEFWIIFTNNQIKLGSGMIYDKDTLAILNSAIPLDMREILFKNDKASIMNYVQILDKEGRKIYLNNYPQCDVQYDINGLDKSIPTCTVIKARMTHFEYKLTNGKGKRLFDKDSNLVIIFKRDIGIDVKINIYITYQIKFNEIVENRICQPEKSSSKGQYLVHNFSCQDIEDVETNLVSVKILIDNFDEINQLFFCEIFFQ